MTRELKQYSSKYLFYMKEGSDGGIEEQKKQDIQKTNKKMADVNPTLSIIH